MQDDDDNRTGEGGSFPLYISLSIGAVFVATLGTIGFVTFRNVQAEPGYVVSVHAKAASAAPAPTAAPVAPSGHDAVAVAAPSRSGHRPRVAARHVAAAPKPAASAIPKASAAPAASPTPNAVASLPAVPRDVAQRKKPRAHGSLSPQRVAEADAGEASDAAPAPATRPVWASTAGPLVAPTETPAPAVATAEPAHAAAAAAPPPAPTPAVVAAAPAPVYAPQRIVEARVKSAAQPEFPSDPSVQGVRGTTSVLVTIGAHGDVIKVALDRSSGHSSFDQAALTAARNSVYAPPEIDGHPATASYRMVYEFAQ